MKILFVVSGNVGIMPFVEEQKQSLEQEGCCIDYFFIYGKGFIGYIKNLCRLKKHIKHNSYNLIHAHYGLAGLFAVMQIKIPVVITFHGSDIYLKKNLIYSFLASRLSKFNIFVNNKMPRRILLNNKYSVIPCGVDHKIFHYLDISYARKKLGLDINKKYILFSSSFDNPIKNFALAKRSLSYLESNIIILELKSRSREEVCLLLNACDLLLVTSYSEGSPQIVKEALFCGTPIISTRVGDVPDLLDGIQNSYLVDYDPQDIANNINKVLAKSTRYSKYLFFNNYSIEQISKRIVEVYRRVY